MVSAERAREGTRSTWEELSWTGKPSGTVSVVLCIVVVVADISSRFCILTSQCTFRKLTLVTSQLHDPTADSPSNTTTSIAQHLNPVFDDATGYYPPSKVRFEWAGQTEGGEGHVKASLETATGSGAVGENNLIEKVDVLAEIPYV